MKDCSINGGEYLVKMHPELEKFEIDGLYFSEHETKFSDIGLRSVLSLPNLTSVIVPRKILNRDVNHD